MNINKAIVTESSIKWQAAKRLKLREDKMLIRYLWRQFKLMLCSKGTTILEHTEKEIVK